MESFRDYILVYLMSLRFTFNCTMLSDIRKSCDSHRICQILFMCIIDMFADCLIATPRQYLIYI